MQRDKSIGMIKVTWITRIQTKFSKKRKICIFFQLIFIIFVVFQVLIVKKNNKFYFEKLINLTTIKKIVTEKNLKFILFWVKFSKKVTKINIKNQSVEKNFIFLKNFAITFFCRNSGTTRYHRQTIGALADVGSTGKIQMSSWRGSQLATQTSGNRQNDSIEQQFTRARHRRKNASHIQQAKSKNCLELKNKIIEFLVKNISM